MLMFLDHRFLRFLRFNIQRVELIEVFVTQPQQLTFKLRSSQHAKRAWSVDSMQEVAQVLAPEGSATFANELHQLRARHAFASFFDRTELAVQVCNDFVAVSSYSFCCCSVS